LATTGSIRALGRLRRSRRLAPSSAERWASPSSAASGLPSTPMARSVEGIPREAAEAARDTLGGAMAAAEQVPGPGAALLETARKAFTDGLQVTAITSALVVIGIAILVARAARRTLGFRAGSRIRPLMMRRPLARAPACRRPRRKMRRLVFHAVPRSPRGRPRPG